MLTLTTKPVTIAPREFVPADETLTETVKRKIRENDPFELASPPVRMTRMEPMVDIFARVSHFDSLLSDIVVLFSSMKFRIDRDASGRGVMWLDVSTSTGIETFRIRAPFWHTFVRFCNDNIAYVSGLSGAFMRGMSDGPIDAQECVCELSNHFVEKLFETYTVRSDNGRVPKTVLLRTILPDASGVWPRAHQARAIVHVGYRDDINHRWLMERMMKFSSSASVVGLQFDGDLLCGGALLPDVSRVHDAGDEEFGGGLFFFSGEVGNRSCGVTPFVFRKKTRVILCVGESWAVTHAGGRELPQLEAAMTRFVDKQIPLVSTYIDRLLLSRNIVIDESEDARATERIIMAASYRMALSMSDLRKWRFAVRAEREVMPNEPLSVFVLQTGLGRLAHVIDDPARQMTISRMAGNLADLEWEKIAERARTISNDHLDEVFGGD